MRRVSGVDHVGIGVKNVQTMREFYGTILGFTEVFGEMPEEDHPPMHTLLRTSPVILSAVQLNNPTGGIFVALFRKTSPIPRPVRKNFRYGDIGLNKVTIAVSDVDRTYSDFRERVAFCSAPKTADIPHRGKYRFVYCKDPEGNLVEFASGETVDRKTGMGGARCIGIGVSDLDRSKAFYREFLQFDRIVIENHEAFSGLVDEVSGAVGTQVRSCVLANEGRGMVELLEVSKPRGRSIPFGVQWGDFGYLQVCLYGDDIDFMANYCTAVDMDFLAPPQIIDDPEHPGGFMYISDPDGIPIEFVVYPHG